VAVPGSGLYYYSPDALGAGETPVTASIKGVQVITMMADPTGGVDYVDDQGQLIRWGPTCQDAHATTCACRPDKSETVTSSLRGREDAGRLRLARYMA